MRASVVLKGQTRQQERQVAYEGENSVSGVLWRQNRGCMSVGSPWKGKHGWNIWLTAADPGKAFMMISMRTARCIACASHRTEVSMRHCADWHLRERNMAGCPGSTISVRRNASDCFAAGDREWNIVDSMATDAQGRLYTRMRMQEDGGYVRIYTAEGDLIGTMADDGVCCARCRSPGTGKGRKSLCSSTGNGECDSRG